MNMNQDLDHVNNYMIWKLMKKTTIKEVKNKLNETFIFGELEANQYFIYKGGDQEDKDKNKNKEPMNYYYKYTEPVLSNDDNKTLKDYAIYDNEVLHKIQLKLLFKIHCRFTPIYVYTDNTLKHFQEKATNIYNDKMKKNLKPNQIIMFYGGEEIGDEYDICMFNMYNHSTITIDINYKCK